ILKKEISVVAKLKGHCELTGDIKYLGFCEMFSMALSMYVRALRTQKAFTQRLAERERFCLDPFYSSP
ncbi:hypothetical protein, partial [Oceanobacillus saliphilus]|uniref:hypothetical protein n=1 Tax=Oceanobacillus saliphilus TaxID=2925834 RepID=UPI00201DA8C3